jgi:hypothetical protein
LASTGHTDTCSMRERRAETFAFQLGDQPSPLLISHPRRMLWPIGKPEDGQQAKKIVGIPSRMNIHC